MRKTVLIALLAASPAHADGILGSWTGEYTCRQGLTGLTLTIQEAPGDQARALFHFYEVDANPGVPEGCYIVEGIYQPETRDVFLRGMKWLVKPDGYAMANMSGTIAMDGSTFIGDVWGPPDCTTFTLDRVREPRPTPVMCSPSQLLSMKTPSRPSVGADPAARRD